MSLKVWLWSHILASRYSGYKPKEVTAKCIAEWLNNLPQKDRGHALDLIKRVRFFSEAEVRKALVERNQDVMDRIHQAGFPDSNIIYVQLHDAGSSSPVMLNMLRDAAKLEKKGCKFVDSSSIKEISNLTSTLARGAIIYVDDFAGTGNQFRAVRDGIAPYILGRFPEYFLAPVICSEAIARMVEVNVIPICGLTHEIGQRPLHEHCNSLNPDAKQRLRALCHSISDDQALGYKEMATMVVLYNNAPNTIPRLFRGSPDFIPYPGVFPRTSDL